MTWTHRRIATPRRALFGAACLAAISTSAFAAETTFTVPEGSTQAAVITASPASGDTFIVENLGTIGFGFGTFGFNVVRVQGTGAGEVVINNDGRIVGVVNFTGATGPVTFNNLAATAADDGWHFNGTVTFGGGDDVLNNAAEGVIAVTANSAATLDFGAGNDTFSNAGSFTSSTLTINDLETLENSGILTFTTATFSGLETLNNSGVLQLNVGGRLIAPGAAFTGSGDSRIVLTAILGGVPQEDCSAASVAACLDFTGGSTAGSTLLTILPSGLTREPALNDGITLIAGSSAASDFVIDPQSEGYDAQTSFGGVIRRGPVFYHLAYDEAGERHMLVGVLADEMVQAATFAATAQDTWRATTGTWLTRQADLRATPGGFEPSNGLWARAGLSAGERELAITTTQGGAIQRYDADHKHRIAHLVFGADVLAGATADAAWVLGGMLGMVRSDVEYDLAPTEVVSTGLVGGLYASYVAGPLFVDAVVNANRMEMIAEMPSLGAGTGVNPKQDFNSVGGQVEAGWRVDMDGGLFIEPLVGASYVKTEFEDIEIPGGAATLDFDDSYTSTRFGAGLRGGMDTQVMGYAASASLTGRYWGESDGENATTVLITNGDTATPVIDDFGGGFGEVGASLNLYSADGGVSGFASLGGRFADDYRSVDASVGVRMRW